MTNYRGRGQIKDVDKLEVFYLPAYLSELNPDEYRNQNQKQAVHGNYCAVAKLNAAIQLKTLSHITGV